MVFLSCLSLYNSEIDRYIAPPFEGFGIQVDVIIVRPLCSICEIIEEMRRVGGAGRSGGLRFLGYRWRYVQMLVAIVAMCMIVICIQAPHILFKTNDSNPEIQSKSSSSNSISESGWDQRDDQTPSNNIIVVGSSNPLLCFYSLE